MKIPFRHGILSCTTNAVSMKSTFIGASSDRARTYDLLCNEPFSFTISHGLSNYVATVPTTTRSAWVDVGNGSYLMVELSTINGAINYTSTTSKPVIGPTLPNRPNHGQYAFNTTTCKMMYWTGTNWISKLAICVAEITPTGMILPHDRGSQINVIGSTNGGWLMVDSGGRLIKKANGEYITIGEEFFVSGVPTAPVGIESAIFIATANEHIARNTFVTVDSAGRARIATYNDIGVYSIGMAHTEASTNESVQVVFSGIITDFSWNFSTHTKVWVDNGGHITTVVPTDGVSEAKPHLGFIVGKSSILLQPVGSGSNPGGGSGEPGLPGPVGPSGPKGDAGIQGPKGDTGDTGIQGPAGVIGPSGVDGIEGPKGDTGIQGPAGVIGPSGPKGDTGPSGADGAGGQPEFQWTHRNSVPDYFDEANQYVLKLSPTFTEMPSEYSYEHPDTRDVVIVPYTTHAPVDVVIHVPEYGSLTTSPMKIDGLTGLDLKQCGISSNDLHRHRAPYNPLINDGGGVVSVDRTSVRLPEVMVAAGQFTSILGGSSHTIRKSAAFDCIVSGSQHTIGDGNNHSLIAGGRLCSIDSSSSSAIVTSDVSYVYNSQFSTIVGGSNNVVHQSYACHVMGSTTSQILNSSRSVAIGSDVVVENSERSGIFGGVDADAKIYRTFKSHIFGGNGTIDGGAFNFNIGSETASILESTNSGVIGGRLNTITDGYCSNIFGGSECTILGTSPVNWGCMVSSLRSTVGGDTSVIVSGQDNTISGKFGVLLGGVNNTIERSCDNSSIINGDGNSFTTYGYGGTIIGGTNNTQSDASKSVILGGANNVITGSYAGAIVGGQQNATMAPRAVILGGSNNAITDGGDGAVAHGSGAQISTMNGYAHASGQFSNRGDAQYTRHVVRLVLIAGTPAGKYGLTLDGVGPNSTNGISVNSGESVIYNISLVGRTVTDASIAMKFAGLSVGRTMDSVIGGSQLPYDVFSLTQGTSLTSPNFTYSVEHGSIGPNGSDVVRHLMVCVAPSVMVTEDTFFVATIECTHVIPGTMIMP